MAVYEHTYLFFVAGLCFLNNSFWMNVLMLQLFCINHMMINYLGEYFCLFYYKKTEHRIVEKDAVM